MNLTDVLDLLGALLVISGVAALGIVLVGLWAGLVAAGLLMLGFSWLVSLRNRGDAE